MAAEPEFVPLLVGLGVHELSMEPASVAMVRRVIRSISFYEAEKTAAQALACPNASASLELSLNLLKRCAPEISSVLEKTGVSGES